MTGNNQRSESSAIPLPEDGPTSAPSPTVLPGSRSPLDPSRSLRSRRSRLPREHVRDVQRSRLLDAGVQVVAELSYEGTGIKAICQRAGVAYNAFYEYFESKEDLLVQAYEVGAQSMLIALAEAYAACTGSWEAKVRAAINRFLLVLIENPPFARFFTIEAPKVGRSITDHVRLTVAAVPTLFVGISPAPTLPMENEELLAFVVGSVSAGISTYVQSGREHKLMDLEDQFVALICTLFTSETSTCTSTNFPGSHGHGAPDSGV